MNERGISLLEVLIVIVLIGLIVAVSVPWTLSAVRRAKSEREVRLLYSNFTEARQRSIERNLPYIITVTDTAVNVYEDSNSDGTAQATEKIGNMSIANLNRDYFSLAGTVTVGGTANAINSTAQNIPINVRGILLNSATIYLNGATTEPGIKDASLNCVSVATTRIGQGRYNGSTCQVQ